MLRNEYKLVSLLLVVMLLLTSCDTPGNPTGSTMVSPSISPVAEAPTASSQTASGGSQETQESQDTQPIPQAQEIPTPPVSTPTPPVHYETDGVIEVWSLTNDKKYSVDDIAEASAFGLVLVAVDGPLPIGDVVALVVIGGTMVLYAVAVAPEVAAALTDAARNLGSVQMAQNPDNILVPVPPATLPIPAIPDHIKNHPRGPYTARLKEAIWLTVFTAWFSNQPPDWCGRRPTDGAVMVVYYGLQITTKVSTKVYSGLALLLNQGGEHLSTGFKDVYQLPDGTPCSGNSSCNDFDQFDPFPCPDPNGLQPITQ